MSRLNIKNVMRLIDAANASLPIEQQFLNDLNATIEKTQPKYKPSRSYTPSSLICPRQMVFKVLGYNVESEGADAGLIRMGEIGSDRHDSVQKSIASMSKLGIDCEYIDVGTYIHDNELTHLQVKSKKGMETHVIDKNLNLSFRTDGIIRYKGLLSIFEYKTEISFKWNNREAVAEEHIPQGTAYATSFNIDNVLFVYESRDTCAKKAFLLPITDAMKYKYVVSKIAYCDEYATQLKIPPKPTSIDPKVCNYCPYTNSCMKEGD